MEAQDQTPPTSKRPRRSTAVYSEPKPKLRKTIPVASVSPGVHGAASAASAAPKPAPTPPIAESTDGNCTPCFLDNLPNHLVLRIFGLLDVQDIAFLIPQVCKRWNRLATEESLWEKSHLHYYAYMTDSGKELFFKCMKMAPKIGALTVELNAPDGDEFFKKIVVDTNGPREIKAINFIYDNIVPNAMFTLLTRHKDHIEKLAITDTHTPYEEDDVEMIWNHIQKLSKLKHLVVDGAALFYHKASFRKSLPCWKTLHILDVSGCSYEDMNTVQRLVASNPNWTEVYLSSTTVKNSRGEVKALSKCANVDTVQLPFCKEIKFVMEMCNKVDSLVIHCQDQTAKEISGVVAYLKGTTEVFPSLKAVKMSGGSPYYAKLLTALIKDRPKMDLLNLVAMDLSADDMQDILSCVPQLKSLYLNEMSASSVSVVLKLGKELLSNLKKVGITECECIEDDICIKISVAEMKEQRPDLEIDFGCHYCTCKPAENVSRAVNNKSNKRQYLTVRNNRTSNSNQKSETQGAQRAASGENDCEPAACDELPSNDNADETLTVEEGEAQLKSVVSTHLGKEQNTKVKKTPSRGKNRKRRKKGTPESEDGEDVEGVGKDADFQVQ